MVRKLPFGRTGQSIPRKIKTTLTNGFWKTLCLSSSLEEAPEGSEGGPRSDVLHGSHNIQAAQNNEDIRQILSDQQDRMSKSSQTAPEATEVELRSKANEAPTTLQSNDNTLVEHNDKGVLPTPSDKPLRTNETLQKAPEVIDLVETEQGSTANDELIALQSNDNTRLKYNAKGGLLKTPSDGRPRTSDSNMAQFKAGIGEIVERQRFIIQITAFGKRGNMINSMPIKALCDTGSGPAWITHKAFEHMQQTLKVKTWHLPRGHQQKFKSPMFGSKYKPTEYISLKVSGGNIGMPETQVSLYLLPDVSSDTESTASERSSSISGHEYDGYDIILGSEFMERHDIGLLARIAVSQGAFAAPAGMFAPIFQDRRSKKQKEADKIADEAQAKKDRKKAEQYGTLEIKNTGGTQGQANDQGAPSSSSSSTAWSPDGSFAPTIIPQAETLLDQFQDSTDMPLVPRGRTIVRTNTSSSGESIFSRVTRAFTGMSSNTSISDVPVGFSVSNTRSNTGVSEQIPDANHDTTHNTIKGQSRFGRLGKK